MGLDAYGYLTIGVSVENEDLFKEERRWNYKDCCKEDAEKGKAFCSTCGTKFKQTTVKVPTEGLTRLVNHLNMQEGSNFSDLVDFVLFDVQQYLTDESNGSDGYVIGSRLLETNSHRNQSNGYCSISLEKIEEEKNKALELAKILGIQNPVANVYLSMYFSY